MAMIDNNIYFDKFGYYVPAFLVHAHPARARDLDPFDNYHGLPAYLRTVEAIKKEEEQERKSKLPGLFNFNF